MLNMLKIMLKGKLVPSKFLSKAIMEIAHILNKCPTKKLKT